MDDIVVGMDVIVGRLDDIVNVVVLGMVGWDDGDKVGTEDLLVGLLVDGGMEEDVGIVGSEDTDGIASISRLRLAMLAWMDSMRA